jgi:hypothetical protein
MASGDTKLKICNDALIMIGSNELTSFADGTDAAKICDRLYDNVKDQVLSSYPWTFSIKKVQLSRLADAPNSEWAYAYQIPGDALGNGIKAVRQSNAVASPLSTDWEIQGDQLLTDLSAVWCDYQYQVAESAMPTYFVLLLKNAVAAEIALPMTGTGTLADRFELRTYGSASENRRGGMMRSAMNTDGIGQPAQAIADFPLINARL